MRSTQPIDTSNRVIPNSKIWQPGRVKKLKLSLFDRKMWREYTLMKLDY